MERLYHKLASYDQEDVYPFHMPGHKRNPAVMGSFFPGGQDITEITGFDNLHHPEGILLEASRHAAQVYGSRFTFLGVNGSTGMILSAISACVHRKGKLLLARNSHRSAYHAVYLRDLNPVYLYPRRKEDMEFNGSVRPEDVEKALLSDSEIEAVFVTSPTYDGVVSDIRSIAEAAHKRGIPLIVDEAHGAHFIFSDAFPESAVQSGADIVIHSVHKTLPSLTQTSLLHICSDRIDRDLVQRFLTIYQSSSPSYILMSSIDACMEEMQEKGQQLFSAYERRLEDARERLCRLQWFRLADPVRDYPDTVYDYDPSKLIISTKNTGMTGQELAVRLREEYRLEMEMSAPSYVIALSSVGDIEEGFERLAQALSNLESEMEEEKHLPERTDDPEVQNSSPAEEAVSVYPEQVVPIAEAMEGKTKTISLMESEGCISAEFLLLYPPGIPLITPGERITGQLLQNVRRYLEQGLTVTGLKDRTNRQIEVIS